MAVTLSDVARTCGIDISTVSRGLRGDARVKPATQEKIRAAAAELGYVPNLAARTLAAGKTGTVWFITPSLGNPLEREPVEHAARFLLDAEYDLLTGLYHNDGEIYSRLINRLHQGVADGAIVIPGGGPEGDILYERLLAQGYPLVFLDRHPEGVPAPVVTTDNEGAVAELVGLCAGEGVKSAVVLYGNRNPVDAARRRGAVKALGRLKIPVVNGDGINRTEGSLAILATNQTVVSQFLAENGVVMKGRTLVFGVFDGWAGEPHPAVKVFTAIQDFETMAHRAVDRILKMINGDVPVEAEIEPVPVLRIDEVRPVF